MTSVSHHTRRYQRLRRRAGWQHIRTVQVGSAIIQVHPHVPVVSINEGHILLTPFEAILFQALLDRPLSVVSNGELLARCRIKQQRAPSRTLKRHMQSIRSKLRESGIDELSIERVGAYGYVVLPLPSLDPPPTEQGYA